jgi:hypothetical protein
MNPNETISVRVAHYEAQREALGVMSAGWLAVAAIIDHLVDQGESSMPLENLATLVLAIEEDLTPLREDLDG